MEESIITKETTQSGIVCKNCGAKLTYAPGTTKLKCQHCGTENEIVTLDAEIEELDFNRYLNNLDDEAQKHDVITVKCDACGAQTSFEENVVSGKCPFCANPIVATSGIVNHAIQPKSLLPFNIDNKQALQLYSQWLKDLWWAPSDLKNYATQDDKLTGMYIPYWTYDADTITSYTGERGDDITETEEYETTDDNGDTIIQSRTVIRTIWYPVSGTVSNSFDNVLINGSNSLPKHYADKLEPWDLEHLVPFNPSYLSGYKTESYQIDLKSGFEKAREIMDSNIQETVCNNIGGSHQRIFYSNTSYNDITFKHLLLPIWISAYQYKNKAYRFLINGRTGRVQGERPYSWVKITSVIVATIVIIILLIKIFS